MPANVQPIYTLTPQTWFISADGDAGTAGPLKTANTNLDGTGTVNTLLTAAASGTYLDTIIAQAAGSCTQSVLRVFINNGSVHTSVANNFLFREVTLPTTTASATQMLQPIEIPIRRALKATYVVLVTIGTTVSAGWWISGWGGDY